MITENQTMQLELEKSLPAGADKVFAALTQPDVFRQWFGPSHSYPVIDIDYVAETGRAYHITLRTPEGEDVTVFGKFLEVTPDSRLRFTWQWKDSEIQDFDTEVDISLSSHGDSTELKLVHSGFAVEEYMNEHMKGWGSGLNRLCQHQAGILDMLGHAIGFVQGAHARFLKTFSFVPDDKLSWSPADTAKTPINVAAHTAISYFALAGMISGEEQPEGTIPELMAQQAAAEAKITTKEEALGALDESFKAVNTAIGSLTPERFGMVIPSPFGELAVAELIFFPGTHAFSHASQIDYIQTCYGDNDPHFGE